MEISSVEIVSSGYRTQVETQNEQERAPHKHQHHPLMAATSNSPQMSSSLRKRSWTDYEEDYEALNVSPVPIASPYDDIPRGSPNRDASMQDASAFSLSPPAAQSTPLLQQLYKPQPLFARASLSAQKARLSPTNRLKARSLFAQMDKASFRAPTPPSPSSIAPAQPTGRIITGIVYTIYERITYGILACAWAWLTTPRIAEPTQVIAVETSSSGNKRRAIEADASITEESEMKNIPGNFPEPSLIITPPISRPGSSDSKEQQPAQSPPQEQAMATEPAVEAKKSVAPADLPSFLRPVDLNTRLEQLTIKINEKNAKRAAAAARRAEEGTPSPKLEVNPYVTSRQRRALQKQEKEHQKDEKVDGLITRARLAAQLSPQYKSYRNYRRRLQILDHEAVEEAREEQAKVKAEREATVQLRAQAEQEAEDARKKAEDEAKAAEEAERQALEAERNKLIRPLEPKWEENVRVAMETKNKDAVLATSPEGVELTRRDFGTLLAPPTKDTSREWLNDEVVNAWFSTITARKLEQDGYVKNANNVPAYVAYNTAWCKTYKDRGAEGLKTWSRRKGIKGEKLLRAEKVFFPINTGAHWMLLIISPQTKTIDFLDSMHNFHPKGQQQWMGVARKWLQMELVSKYHADEWTESAAKSSLQTNGNDCGAFTCFNALAAAKGRGYEEVKAEKMQEARRIMGAILLNGGFKGDFEL